MHKHFLQFEKKRTSHLKAQTFHVPPLNTNEMKLKNLSKNSVEIFKRGTFLPYAQTFLQFVKKRIFHL